MSEMVSPILRFCKLAVKPSHNLWHSVSKFRLQFNNTPTLRGVFTTWISFTKSYDCLARGQLLACSVHHWPVLKKAGSRCTGGSVVKCRTCEWKVVGSTLTATEYQRQLSVPSLVSKYQQKSFGVNRHTTRCNSFISIHGFVAMAGIKMMAN